MFDWTEKYRPKKFDSLIIERYKDKKTNKIIDPKVELLQWAKEWISGLPHKKAIILSGKPGIGKTSCAYVLAKHFNWIPIELNTSDARNKACIRSIATAGSQHQSFDNNGYYISTKDHGRKLIILDEADNLYERGGSGSYDEKNLSDWGGKLEIIRTVQITKHPIILIVNNYYELIKGSGELLKRLCLHLEFLPPSHSKIYSILKKIIKQEKIEVDEQVLHYISTRCKGDIRSAIRDLQSLSIGRNKVTYDQILPLGFRDSEEQVFNVLISIFRGSDIAEIRNRILHLNVDPQMLLLWIVENIPRSYQNSYDYAQALHHASKADIYLSRTYRRSNYGMWAYATEHMSLGISLSKKYQVGYQSLSYPTWIRKQKKNYKFKEKESLITELTEIHHCSYKKVEQNIYPFIQKLISNNSINVNKISKEKTNSKIKKKTKKIESSNIGDTENRFDNKKKNEEQKTLFF